MLAQYEEKLDEIIIIKEGKEIKNINICCHYKIIIKTERKGITKACKYNDKVHNAITSVWL